MKYFTLIFFTSVAVFLTYFLSYRLQDFEITQFYQNKSIFGTVLIVENFPNRNNLATFLAKNGFHVLVGVKSEKDMQDYVYDRVKGIEPIVFDSTEPYSILHAVYRVKEIYLQLNRALVGVIINLSGRNIYSISGLKLLYTVNYVLLRSS